MMKQFFTALAIVTTMAFLFALIILLARPKEMPVAAVTTATIPLPDYKVVPVSRPLPPLHRFTRPTKVDETAFSPTSFAQSAKWLCGLSQKQLPDNLVGTEVAWEVTVEETSSWGASFTKVDGIGIGNKNKGLHERINPYRTSFFGQDWHVSERVLLKGTVVEVANVFGLNGGYCFILDYWAIYNLDKGVVHANH